MKMPASFAEFSDALQKARIKDGSFCKNELTCIHYNGLTHAMIGWNANLYDLNLFAQRLASLTEEQKKGMDALLKIKQNHRVAPIPLNQLINLTYNTDICCFAPRVSNHEELGAFLYANEMLSNEAMALLDTTEEGSGFQERLLELLGEQHQEDHGGVFTDFGYAELGGEIKDIYVCQSNETACFHRSDAPVMLEVRKGFFNDPSYDNDKTAVLNLPAADAGIWRAVEKVDAASVDECAFRCVDCLIPFLRDAINNAIDDEDGIEQADEFAKRLAQIEREWPESDMVKYKALLSVVDHPSLQDATRLMGEIDQYELRPEVAQTWGYPFNYSGKTDPHGFYIGKDKYGANILVDFDKRDDDKTSANILILGNSGQGKSYLLKLLLLNFLEAGKSVISLDVEHEQKDMCETVGGCFMDLMGGVYRINPLEPKCWDDGSGPEDRDAPEAFRKSTRLSQHISFLKDFFRAYKDFSDRHIDAIEIMVGKLYAKWGISDSTNFAGLKPQDYPILSDLYKLIEQEYREYDGNCHQLYTAELLQEILLGLHSMCQGAEAQFFNGHTNVTSSRFIVFGVKGLLQASKNVRGAMLFNILSYMSDRLLTIGNTTAALDELYVWLSDNVSVGTTIIEYIRNTLKRVRKKESNLIMASQNLEDFDREGIRELTKPLFAIPPHQFIFNCGSIDKRFYMDLLQLEEAEYNLIRFPQRGVCLFKCGNERYLLEVHAPAYKEALFGTAGGR